MLLGAACGPILPGTVRRVLATDFLTFGALSPPIFSVSNSVVTPRNASMSIPTCFKKSRLHLLRYWFGRSGWQPGHGSFPDHERPYGSLRLTAGRTNHGRPNGCRNRTGSRARLISVA